MSTSRYKPFYILKAFSYIKDSRNYVDLACVDTTIESANGVNKLVYIRIEDVQPEFLVLQFPRMSKYDFIQRLEKLLQGQLGANRGDVVVSEVELQDSQFFTPYPNTYAQITCNNHFTAQKALNIIKTYATTYFASLNHRECTPREQLMLNHSETPFRNTSCITLDKLPTFISTKFDIPQVGSVVIDMDRVEKKTVIYNSTGINDVLTTNASTIYITKFEDIARTFITPTSLSKSTIKPDTYHQLIRQADMAAGNVKIMAYDIETYKPLTDTTWDMNKPNHQIITIGFSIFNIKDAKPVKRCAIIPRGFEEDEVIKIGECEYELRDRIVSREIERNYVKYMIDDYDLPSDCSTYYTVDDERDMLQLFINIIHMVRPFCIIGFNNWGFDDQWIQAKLKQYNLDTKFLNALTPYNTVDDSIRMTQPIYTSLSLKFDGEVVNKSSSGRASWKNGFTSFYDAMFSQIKEDAKRFNESGSKSLSNMLKVYNIKSPYSDDIETLSKSGLTYAEMFDAWETNKSTFRIAHYCLQDAWITGVFAIRRNMIGDKMEMANTTHTSFQDSILRADNVRVGNTIIHYAYNEGFAIYDSPDTNSRTYRLKSVYSDKVYDKRTIIGGAVKNKRNGREMDIVAVDFSSMYPSQKEGSNTDTSSRVDQLIINQPEAFGLKQVKKYYLEDMYTNRWFYVFEDESGKQFEVEEHFAEFKTNSDAIEKIKERYNTLMTMNTPDNQNDIKPRITYLYDRLKAELYPLYKHPSCISGTDGLTSTALLEYIMTSKSKVNIPPTVKVPVYYCQSPKDSKTLLPTIHYSLKEKLLSDFRAKRKQVKATPPRDATHKTQLDAKEKAIKVVMNSEYGQTGNDAFGWYDSDVAAAVTYASRHCIAECSTCLTTHHFYVDESYLEDKNLKSLMEFCKKNGHPDDIKIEKIVYDPLKMCCGGMCDEFANISAWIFEGTQRTRDELQQLHNDINFSTLQFNTDYYSIIDFILPPRRLTMERVYSRFRHELEQQLTEFGYDVSDMTKYKSEQFINIYSKLKHPEVYMITLPPSSVVYQDTDSNYYTNEHLSAYYSIRNPETALEIMEAMILHNNLISRLIPDIIRRPPIGVGFEGAFLIARYLNKKKKYYGKKWNPGVRSWIEIPRTHDYFQTLNTYESTHIIIPNSSYKQTPNDHGPLYTLNTLPDSFDPAVDDYYIRYDFRNLPDDYEEYLLRPSGDKEGNYMSDYSTIPFKDGSYMKFTLKDVEDCNLLDFVHHFGIKCTGVDLARRDQFKFVNFNHLLVLMNDLKYTSDSSLETPNIVANQSDKFKLWGPIHDLLLNFAGTIKHKSKQDMKTPYELNWLKWHESAFVNDEADVFYPWSELSADEIHDIKLNRLHVYTYKDFPLEYYAKIVKYDPTKSNGMKEVVGKLTAMIHDTGLDAQHVKDKILELQSSQPFTQAELEVLADFNVEELFKGISSMVDVKVKIPKAIKKLVYDPITMPHLTSFINSIMQLIQNVMKSGYSEVLQSLVPKVGDRVPYLIVDPNNNKVMVTSSKGNDTYADRKDKGYMLSQLRTLYSDDEIYEMLDYRFYFNQLATSLCNYLAIEFNPSIADYLSEEFELQHPNMTANDIKDAMDKQITQAIIKIKKPIIDTYYPQMTKTSVMKACGIKRQRNALTEISDQDYTTIMQLVAQLNHISLPFEYSIPELQTYVNKWPLDVQVKLCPIVQNLTECLNKSYLLLRSGKTLDFDVEYLDTLQQLINLYNLILNKISKTLVGHMRESGEMSSQPTCLDAYVYKDKTVGEWDYYKVDVRDEHQRPLKNKCSYKVPKYILTMTNTPPAKVLIDMFTNYLSYTPLYSQYKQLMTGFKIHKESCLIDVMKEFMMMLN